MENMTEEVKSSLFFTKKRKLSIMKTNLADIKFFLPLGILLQTPWGMFLTTAGGGRKGCVNYSTDNVSFKKLEEVGEYL